MKSFLAALISAVCLASCAPSTPQARIDKHPEKFSALSKKNQELVQKGLITRGMTPDAVELAWGTPTRRFEGFKDSRSTDRWDYERDAPVYFTGYASGFYGGYGGTGPYGRGAFNSYGFGMGPEFTYVPNRVASVWFVDQRVDSWEQVR